jgi:hypothetical protein
MLNDEATNAQRTFLLMLVLTFLNRGWRSAAPPQPRICPPNTPKNAKEK